MDDKIKFIIDEYIASVNEVCHKLLKGINEQENLNPFCLIFQKTMTH